ncbi:MAG TPA: amidohydrolase family protein [Firmicutes bacterium]|nr:amidohydrolase family protein [Candidatus Fermentithermobacillaceae bacterium]
MYAIVGARLHTAGPKGTFTGTLIVNDDSGKIVDAVERASLPSDCRALEGQGLEIAPGFVDAHSHAGFETQGITVPDADERTSLFSPHLHALDALNPLEGGLRKCFEGGVTTVCVLPGSPIRYGPMAERIGVISGVGAVVKTRFDGQAPTVLREHAALKMALGQHPLRYAKEMRRPPATRMNLAALIREIFERAKSEVPDDDKSSAGESRNAHLAAVLRREYPVAFHVHRLQDIQMAMRLQAEYGFDMVLHHATEAHLAAHELAQASVPCVLGPIVMPRRGSELRNATLNAPGALIDAGVKIALMSDHPTFPGSHLPYHAGVLVREGVSHESALRVITSQAAEILGVADKVGSLEPGKDADFVLFGGDPLEIVSPILAVVTDGVAVYGCLPEDNGDRPEMRAALLARGSSQGGEAL